MSSSNPIKEDAELRQLLLDLQSIETKRDFNRWKASFCERFSQFLTTDGSTAATQRRNAYDKELSKFCQSVQELEMHIANGDLVAASNRSTVKARKCLAEFHKHMTRVTDATNTLIPGTGEQAREMGYTKFHMGAVLIRDGFQEYDRLSLCEDILARLRSTTILPQVADKQVLEEMENYVDKVGMFCDIMADLGLHGAMLRCHQLNQLEEEPEPEPEPEAEAEAEPEPSESSQSEESMEPPQVKKYTTTDLTTSFKGNDHNSDGRLEMTTQMHGSFSSHQGGDDGDGDNDKSFTLGFPGIKPPDGPFIRFMPPEEYKAKRAERERAAKLKAEADAVAYKPVVKPNFKLGGHYHGSSNVLNCTIKPDLEDDYSSGTDSPSSDDSDAKKKKAKQKTKKKVIVKKVVKKKVLKQKPKEGGTTDKPSEEGSKAKAGKKETTAKTSTSNPADKTSPPVLEIARHEIEHEDEDDLTMNTLSPDHRIKQKLSASAVLGGSAPSALTHESSEADDVVHDHSSSDESSSSSDDEDESLTINLDFDKIEGVKSIKKTHAV